MSSKLVPHYKLNSIKSIKKYTNNKNNNNNLVHHAFPNSFMIKA